MNKITILMLIVIISGVGIGIAINGNGIDNTEDNNYGSGSGCCIDPPCSECFEKLGYCKCDEWAKTDGFICGECEITSPDCGKDNNSEICELD